MRASERNEGLLIAIDRAEETAYGSDEKSALAKDRALAIDMYWGKNLQPAPEGRSQVRDRSVFETINWILPSIVDIFAGGDDVIKLPPVNADDEMAALQEEQFLNYQMVDKNPWLEIVLTLAVDSMLTKNAYVYIYREYKREVDIDRYEGQTKESLTLLLEDKDAKVTEQKAYPDPDGAQEPVMGPDGQPLMEIMGIDPASGQPQTQPAMQPVMLYDVTIRTTRTHGGFCIDVLPPEHCKISERTPSFRLKDCPYFEYWAEDTLSNLRKRGFDIDDDINDEDSDDTQEDLARNQYNENNDETNAADPSLRLVKVRTIWIEYDYDGDGIAELQRVLRVGRQILEREEVSRIPIACTVPMPVPHRHIGMSIADITKDLQEIKTAILRQGLDNLYLSNNARIAISNKVSIEDVLLSRPGQPIRVDTEGPDAGAHIFPIQTPFVFHQAMEGLEYMDQVKENRAGVSRYFTGVDQNSMNKTASGQNQLITMAQQRVKLLARIFGCCIEDMGSILHEVILKSGHKKETVQLRNKWVTVNPAEWKRRKDFKTQVAYAAGNKDSLVQKLLLMATKQGEAMTGGVPIVTPENLYKTGMELAKAMDFANGDNFWTDPQKIPPKGPPQPDATVVAMEQIKTASAEKIKAADVQQKNTADHQANALEKYRIDMDNTTKLKIAQMQVESERQKAHMQHEHAMQQKEFDGHQAAGLEGVKANLSPKTKEADAKKSEVAQKDTALKTLMERLDAGEKDRKDTMSEVLKAVTSLAGPRKILRDKAGKAIGTEPA